MELTTEALAFIAAAVSSAAALVAAFVPLATSWISNRSGERLKTLEVFLHDRHNAVERLAKASCAACCGEPETPEKIYECTVALLGVLPFSDVPTRERIVSLLDSYRRTSGGAFSSSYGELESIIISVSLSPLPLPRMQRLQHRMPTWK